MELVLKENKTNYSCDNNKHETTLQIYFSKQISPTFRGQIFYFFFDSDSEWRIFAFLGVENANERQHCAHLARMAVVS